MEVSNPVVWRLEKDTHKWLLFNNNAYQLPAPIPEKAKEKDQEKLKKLKKESATPFFFAKIKAETKGSLVYTPKGYGIIQSIKLDQNLITVKVNNEISDYQKQDAVSEIPVDLIFVSTSGKREDKAILPIHSTAKDIVERIESECDADSLSSRIFFHGKELSKSNESLEKMGVVPFSKFLVIAAMGKPLSVLRFATTEQGWGYSNSSIDAITFVATRDIRVIGFGIYTPDNDNAANGSAKFVQGNDVKGTVLYQRDLSLTKNLENPESKIFKFLFTKPIKIKSGDSYTCCVELKSGNTYYGSGGITSPMGENDVTFTITSALGSNNGTGPSSGQIPEIYYYI
jgi:hypothetical protein